MSPLHVTLSVLAMLFTAGSAEAQSAEWVTPAGYEVGPLTPLQLASIEEGAADLGGATEQFLLSTSLYVASAATLVGGVVTLVLLFTELRPDPGIFEATAPALADFGAMLGSFVAHAVTTPLAITIGIEANRRRDRARRELLLELSAAGVGGRF